MNDTYNVEDEIRRFRENGFNEDFARNYFFVKMDLFEIRIVWRLFRNFYGTNPERVDLLNKASGATAQTLQKVLFEAVLLGLRRLTDKDKSRNATASISVRSLYKFIPEGKQIEFKREVESPACKACEFAVNWADKKIAHSTYEHRNGIYQLKPASRKAVGDAIDAVANVIKWIERELFKTIQVTHSLSGVNDEVRFLEVLYEGIEALKVKEELSRKYSQEGKYADRAGLYQYPKWLERDEDILDIE